MSAPSPSTLTRRVDLRGTADFARALVEALRAAAGTEVLPALRSGVHGVCPQCQLRLFGEDVLALAASEAPRPEVSPKLHRLSQGFCGRQGCGALFYEFTFDPVPGLDWVRVLGDSDASLGVNAPPAVAAEQAATASRSTTRRRTTLRVAAGLGVVGLLLVVRHILTGGTIPWIREPRQFTADPATVPRRGETHVGTPAAPARDTNAPAPFRAAKPPPQR
jgi:hypothetical protein